MPTELKPSKQIAVNEVCPRNVEEWRTTAKFVSPVWNIQRIEISKIVANDYNPNSIATPEMKLLEISIREDGLTMPIVVYHDKDKDIYIIVDGFHRFQIIKNIPDLYEREGGCIAASVIDKDMGERMASTIRHNRARGSHDVDLMSNIVCELHNLGRSDSWIAKYLGMDKNEILRLKQISGLSDLFRDREFNQSWISKDAKDDVLLRSSSR